MKVKKLLFSFLAICGMLTGCLSEPDFAPVLEDGIPINLDGSITQVATRVNAQGFEDKDALGLYAVNYENSNQTPGVLLDQGNQADHVKYIFDEASWKWTPVKPVYYKDVNTNVDLYAFYPHAEPSSVSAYNFEVQKDQSTAEKEGRLSGYEASDFLWGKAENITPTESKIKIQLNHMMAGVQVVLKEGDGFDVAGDWELLDKKVLVTNTTRKASIDLSTGIVTPIGGPQATGIVMCPQSDASFRAIVVPQTVEAQSPLFSITVGGTSYDFIVSESFTYKAGKLSTVTIKVNRKYPSGDYEFVLTDTQIADWKEDINTHEGEARQYYCVHCEEPGTLSRLIKADKKNPDKIKNLKVSGKIDACDFYFIRDSMRILQALNLTESVIKNTTCASWYNNGRSSDLSDKDNNQIYSIHYYGEYDSALSNTNWEGELRENEIPCGAFEGKESLSYFNFPQNVTYIGTRAFAFSGIVGALIIPDSVLFIDDSAFAKCRGITSLTLPTNLKKIERRAFQGCNGMTCSLNLPSSLEYIGFCAFKDCSSLTGTLILPENLVVIDGGAFEGCAGFRGDLIIPESVKSIYGNTFLDCSGLNGTLKLHDGVNLLSKVGLNETINGSKGSHFKGCSFQGELTLPSVITTIPDYCFAFNKFSSISDFPDDLVSIGNYSFYQCRRLSKIAELPRALITIGEGAFAYCSQLEGIILPVNLSVIGVAAFNQCYFLNSIISHSSEPPYVLDNAFDGVAKDNFTVEVPGNAVTRYKADAQWGEFRRISAHHDFSISRSLARSLNAETSKTYILRAPSGLDWSIESKPDWVTVTPSSGTGKTEVTVTFAEMRGSDVGTFELELTDEWGNYQGTTTYDGRAGEIVFLLNDKDYRSRMTVEQYDYEYGDGDVLTLHEATKGSGVNLVFLADCYDAKDIADGSYLRDIQEAYGYYFDVEPYKTYKDYFNVYTVFGESDDSGMGTVNTIRDAKFGSQYSLNGVSPDFAICYEYAAKADPNMIPGQTLIVMVENTTEYGGVCYMWGDGSAVACCPKSRDAYPYDFRGIVQHEAGGHG